ncbi:AAA family ATPase [Paracoccus pacificus]|uniref:AAA family ATPase n=1 Tax=Paracoccus pacificus TaxID=1463598 RepID=A0ABW4R845_9RHOB
MSDRLFVVTGAPGAGKTSLINALSRQGLSAMPEAGRAIIQDQVRIGGHALPWADRALFAELMLAWDMRSHRAAGALAGPVLMDRGIPDIVGYLTLCGLSVPAHVRAAAEGCAYNRRVFLAPHWDAIFATDAERKQNRAEAVATEKVMRDTYARLGYQIVELPRAPIAARADFVLRHL